MKLWIRSQDKKGLFRVSALFVDEDSFKKGEYRIVAHEGWLGKYKTKERALEVLDEIQKLLQPQMVLSKVGKPIGETCDGRVFREPDEYDIKEISTYVYEMPKE